VNPAGRWLLVAGAAVVLVAAPVVVRALPASGSDLTAPQLRERIAASSSVPWSGEVRTRGTLQVPDTRSFGGVVDLLGESKDLRVWWRDARHWRVDDTRQTGESDLVRDDDTLTRWVFESATATITPYATVRLPDASDVLPSRLASRLLGGAAAAELTRLPSRRVAGRSAAGLRLEPADPASTIDRADVWADERTGLPMRVEVYGDGDALPVVTSSLTDLDIGRPAADVTTFAAPRTATVRRRDAIDVAAGANAFAPFRLPDQVAGLERTGDEDELGAVGVYGRGPTALIVIPLRRGLAGQVRDQLSTVASARSSDAGTSLEVGPLSVLLTEGGRRSRGTFLLAGTVTPATLAQASAELATGVTFR
jgi:outer membrane lipoprotein-sorting protein